MKDLTIATSVKLTDIIKIQCPACDKKPPTSISGGLRWKWLALHILVWCKGGSK